MMKELISLDWFVFVVFHYLLLVLKMMVTKREHN